VRLLTGFIPVMIGKSDGFSVPTRGGSGGPVQINGIRGPEYRHGSLLYCNFSCLYR
jgi:hypothetical protein